MKPKNRVTNCPMSWVTRVELKPWYSLWVSVMLAKKLMVNMNDCPGCRGGRGGDGGEEGGSGGDKGNGG